MRTLILPSLLFAAFALSGCVVLEPASHAPGHSGHAMSKHPHGGPPGQQKKHKVAKASKHHPHSVSCGHKRQRHGGGWIYFVDGQWWRPSGSAWVLVEVDSE